MIRSQMISKISRQTGLPSTQVENILDAIFNNIIESLQQDEKVTIAGFGRFEMRERQAKAYMNPKTKVSSQLAPTRIPGFKPSGLMKERIAGTK